MMDILLSLPLLSLFLGGGITTWSTSINLLLLYTTWSALVLSHSPLHIQLLGALAIRLALFLLPALLFLLFDSLLPSLAQSIKHGGRPSLPPRHPRALATTLLLSLANTLLATALEAAASWSLTRLLGHVPFSAATTLPLPWAILKHIGLLYAAREIFTYHIHRYLLHAHFNHSHTWTRGAAPVRSARAWLSSQHARYAHARRAAPYSLALAADHPAAFLLHRLAPVYVSALAVRPHLLVYFLFLGLVTLEETLTMSGYTIVPGIVMGGIARRNAAHYGGGGDGGYGAWGVLDWGCGSGVGGGGGDVQAGDAVGAVQNGIDGIRKGRKKAKGGSD